jgi:hypothetical protein
MDFIYLIVVLLLAIHSTRSFMPAKIIDKVIDKIDGPLKLDLGNVSKTYVHDEIVKLGLTRSIVKYFYEQPNGSRRVNMSKIRNEYLDLRNLYRDYYGAWVCDLPVAATIKVLQVNVASVDLDPTTKNFPHAHFDAETFNQSNSRVIEFTNRINDLLANKRYQEAVILSGQILHTIQDFYSRILIY